MDRRERAREFEVEALCHVDGLARTAVRLTGSRTEADDLVQETVLRAFASWDQYVAGTNCRAWLYRILMNAFINGYRRRARERDLLDLERDPTRADDLVSQSTRSSLAPTPGVGVMGDEVRRALAGLVPEFRAVVLLVDVEEMSYRDVADALGCPVGTVMSRLHRARRMLQHQLRGYAEAEGYVRAEAA